MSGDVGWIKGMFHDISIVHSYVKRLNGRSTKQLNKQGPYLSSFGVFLAPILPHIFLPLPWPGKVKKNREVQPVSLPPSQTSHNFRAAKYVVWCFFNFIKNSPIPWFRGSIIVKCAVRQQTSHEYGFLICLHFFKSKIKLIHLDERVKSSQPAASLLPTVHSIAAVVTVAAVAAVAALNPPRDLFLSLLEFKFMAWPMETMDNFTALACSVRPSVLKYLRPYDRWHCFKLGSIQLLDRVTATTRIFSDDNSNSSNSGMNVKFWRCIVCNVKACKARPSISRSYNPKIRRMWSSNAPIHCFQALKLWNVWSGGPDRCDKTDVY